MCPSGHGTRARVAEKEKRARKSRVFHKKTGRQIGWSFFPPRHGGRLPPPDKAVGYLQRELAPAKQRGTPAALRALLQIFPSPQARLVQAPILC